MKSGVLVRFDLRIRLGWNLLSIAAARLAATAGRVPAQTFQRDNVLRRTKLRVVELGTTSPAGSVDDKNQRTRSAIEFSRAPDALDMCGPGDHPEARHAPRSLSHVIRRPSPDSATF